MPCDVAIYTRFNYAQAWCFERTSNLAAAHLAQNVNAGMQVETLVVPLIPGLPKFLDSAHVQSDFPECMASATA